MMSVDDAAAELHFLDQRRRQAPASRRRIPGLARKLRTSPALRAKRAVADRRAAAFDRDRPAPWPGRAPAAPAAGGPAAIAVGDCRLGRGDDCAASATPLRSVDEGLAVPIPALVGAAAGHHHRRPVLAGDGDVAAAGGRCLQQVAERRHAQDDRARPCRRSTSCPGRARPRRNRRALSLRCLRQVEPIIGDDPGARRARCRS